MPLPRTPTTNTIVNGLYGVRDSGSGAETTAVGNTCVNQSTAAIDGVTSNAQNLIGDASVSGTNTDQNVTWPEIIRNAGHGEEDLRVTESREWQDGLIAGRSFENGSLVSVTSAYHWRKNDSPSWWSVHADAAKRGSYGLQCVIPNDANTATYYKYYISPDTQTDSYFAFWFKSTLVFQDSGDRVFFAGIYDDNVVAGGGIAELALRYDGSDIYIYNAVIGTDPSDIQVIAADTWYFVEMRLNAVDTTGSFTFWVDGSPIAGTTGEDYADDPDTWQLTTNGSQVDMAGTLFFDHLQISDEAIGEPDDSTSPYGDDARDDWNDKVDQGANYRTDIQLVERSTSQNDWLPGGWGVAGGAPSSIVVLRRRIEGA